LITRWLQAHIGDGGDAVLTPIDEYLFGQCRTPATKNATGMRIAMQKQRGQFRTPARQLTVTCLWRKRNDETD
jgi:hypothetical protein